MMSDQAMSGPVRALYAMRKSKGLASDVLHAYLGIHLASRLLSRSLTRSLLGYGPAAEFSMSVHLGGDRRGSAMITGTE